MKKRVDVIDKSAYVHPDIPLPGDIYQVTEDVVVVGREDSGTRVLRTQKPLPWRNTRAFLLRGTLLTFIGVASSDAPSMGVWLASGTGNIIEHPFLGEDMELLKLVARAK